MNPVSNIAFSAPGEPPPPLPRDTHGTDPKVQRDVVKIVTMVSDIHRNMLESHEDNDGQNLVVSNTRAL